MRSKKNLIFLFVYIMCLIGLCFVFDWAIALTALFVFFALVLYLRHKVHQYEKEKSYQRIVGAHAHMVNCRAHAPANLHVEAVRNFCRTVRGYHSLRPRFHELKVRKYLELYRELKDESELVRDKELSF